jgi:hypothetical protein
VLGIALFKADNGIMGRAGNKRMREIIEIKTTLTVSVTFFCEMGKEKTAFIN